MTSLPPPDPQTPETDANEHLVKGPNVFSPYEHPVVDSGFARSLEKRLGLASAKLEQMEKALTSVWVVTWINPDTMTQGIHGVFSDENYASEVTANFNREHKSIYRASQWIVAKRAAIASSLNTEKKT